MIKMRFFTYLKLNSYKTKNKGLHDYISNNYISNHTYISSGKNQQQKTDKKTKGKTN